MKVKNKAKKILCLCVALYAVILFTGCGTFPELPNGPSYGFSVHAGDEFTEITESPFVDTKEQPQSFFSMDVSTASYSIIRSRIRKGLPVGKDMVKIEEMLNYFRYDDPLPAGGAPLALSGNIFPCPWNGESKLFRIGVRAKDIERSTVRSNLVFLLDVSGSMHAPDKLQLMQSSFKLLTENLYDHDRISIVTYAGRVNTILSGVSGGQKLLIQSAIDDLSAGGSTAGAGGIQRAYALAEQHYISGGNNRIILATDGDFNVGVRDQEDLEQLIQNKRSQSKGVYLSVMGFGMGNLKSNVMDTLARNGNGTAYYIDSVLEAKKALVEEINGTLLTVADDVKALVEFDPAKVEKYRLLGYETKMLSYDDWIDAQADAGEIGAGHAVTAIYEIRLAKEPEASSEPANDNHWLKAMLRYKEPHLGKTADEDAREVLEITQDFGMDDMLSMDQFLQKEDLVFIACVVESALILRDSVYKADARMSSVIRRLKELSCIGTDVYKQEFLSLMELFESSVNNQQKK